MLEFWKDITGYEGIYQVSSQGRVRSLPRFVVNSLGVKKFYPGRILAQRTDKGGYKIIDLRNGKIQKTHKVHRLVAIEYIENPCGLPEVNHKNEFEKWNNNLDNLEWVTSKQNMNYGTLPERIAKKFAIPVYQHDLRGSLIKVWKSAKECGRNGYSETRIHECCKGNQKKYRECVWSYVNQT